MRDQGGAQSLLFSHPGGQRAVSWAQAIVWEWELASASGSGCRGSLHHPGAEKGKGDEQWPLTPAGEAGTHGRIN